MQGQGAAAGKATWQRELLGLEQPCCWATLSIHPSPSIYQNTNSLQLSLSESIQYHSRQCHSFIWSPQVLVASKPH